MLNRVWTSKVLTIGLSIAVVLAVMLFSAVMSGAAEPAGKGPVSFAVKSTPAQTTIGPSDAPVRTAEYRGADKSGVKFQTVRWRGRGYYGAYSAYPAYYPSYSYYPAPVYSYYYPAAPVYTYVPRRAYYAPAPMYVPYGTYYYYGW
jgi:hypothetical protein